MYLYDTNLVSELRKGKRANPRVRAWAGEVTQSASWISAGTIFELEKGILLLERRDPEQGSILRTWLDEYVLIHFAGRILPVDAAVARRSAAFHVPDPKPERDALIAGTAVVHDLVVATRNVSDFEPLGVEVVDPWER